DGTPRALLRQLPGRTLLVEAHEPRRAQRALEGAPEVIALAQVGTALRVLAANGDDVARTVAERLRAAGIEAGVQDTAPNLEDVFVAATRRPGATRAAAQAPPPGGAA